MQRNNKSEPKGRDRYDADESGATFDLCAHACTHASRDHLQHRRNFQQAQHYRSPRVSGLKWRVGCTAGKDVVDIRAQRGTDLTRDYHNQVPYSTFDLVW